jgi:hypothetical protein
MTFWHYALAVMGVSGYKLDKSKEHVGNIQLKVWTKETSSQTFVKISGVNAVKF